MRWRPPFFMHGSHIVRTGLLLSLFLSLKQTGCQVGNKNAAGQMASDAQIFQTVFLETLRQGQLDIAARLDVIQHQRTKNGMEGRASTRGV